MRKQTLKQAVAAVRAGKIVLRCGLDGCPVGGWPETEQAKLRLAEELPRRSERSYSVDDLISALYVVDFAGRYRYVG
jgi:hypothetical protein